MFYTDFYIIIFAVQNLQHPYLSYCIPCHRLPLRSLHWPSRDQKGILNIHPIIRLRRISGTARLVGLSPFFLLLPFCYGTVFTLPVLRDRFVLFVGVFLLCLSHLKPRPKFVLWCDRESNSTSWAGPLPSSEMVPEGRAFGVRGSEFWGKVSFMGCPSFGGQDPVASVLKL